MSAGIGTAWITAKTTNTSNTYSKATIATNINSRPACKKTKNRSVLLSTSPHLSTFFSPNFLPKTPKGEELTIRQKTHTYSMQLLPHIPILTHQLWHLLLQPIILLHQQLVHCSEFAVHSLKPRSLLSLLLPTPAHHPNPHLRPTSRTMKRWVKEALNWHTFGSGTTPWFA